jgi:3-methyladenine DNA glycosylase AlkD
MSNKMNQVYQQISEALMSLHDIEKAKFLQRFFKTSKGEYAEGDIFLGIKVPEQRMIAKSFYKQCSSGDIQKLLNSKYHEFRLTALIIMTLQYAKAKTLAERKSLYELYINNLKNINNWDLVDTSAPKIIAPYLYETQQLDYLNQLADSNDLWIKRIAIVSLMYLWKKDCTTFGLNLILKNLTHKHDLIHKANGWMLRELTKIDEGSMIEFLKKHYSNIPRTTLRYAIEKLEETERKAILIGAFSL